jgi:hypothetical protein
MPNQCPTEGLTPGSNRVVQGFAVAARVLLMLLLLAARGTAGSEADFRRSRTALSEQLLLRGGVRIWC